MVTAEEVRGAVDAYGASYANRAREDFLALFAPEATLTAPVPTAPRVGHEGIGAFFDGAMANFRDFAVIIDRTIVCAQTAAVDFHVEATLANGTRLGVHGIDVFTFDTQGLIIDLTAYWDPSEFAPPQE